jgi:deoxyribonuclease-4
MSVLEKSHAEKHHKFENCGFHVNRGTDMIHRIDAYRNAGFNTFQIFASNPRQLMHKPSAKAISVFDEFAKYIHSTGINIYIHSPYTINLSNPYHRTAYWNTALIKELEIAEQLGSCGVVVHTGRYKEQDRDVGIANMVANISYVIQIAKSKVPLLIETPAGQGTELGVELEELAYIWKQIPVTIRKRLGICIDTCHIFAAGYDLRTTKAVNEWFAKFDTLIGIKHLKFVHLNDSRMSLGSHIDRHAELKKGEIGDDLGVLFHAFYRRKIPIIVETPGDFKTDLHTLVKWIS